MRICGLSILSRASGLSISAWSAWSRRRRAWYGARGRANDRVLVVHVGKIGFEARQPDHAAARHLERTVKLFLHQFGSRLSGHFFNDELREVNALAGVAVMRAGIVMDV